MSDQDNVLSGPTILKRLNFCEPGDRIIFDPLPGFSLAPSYANDEEWRAARSTVQRLLGEERGMVFHRRIKVRGRGSFIVREFVAVRPETIRRLTEALERYPMPKNTVTPLMDL